MRVALGNIHLGDFVAGAFTLPQNPVKTGMGEFVDGKFVVPQNPVSDAQGMSGCGCGGGCGGGCGMGAVDLSWSGTGLASSVGLSTPFPNYWIYGLGIGILAGWVLTPNKAGKRGFRR